VRAAPPTVRRAPAAAPAIAPIATEPSDLDRSLHVLEDVARTEIGKAPARPPHATASALGLLARDEVRRGVILAEVLGAPVSLRRSERVF
jgi:hypothetical protein